MVVTSPDSNVVTAVEKSLAELGRLAKGTEAESIVRTKGMIYVPVEHEGNSSRSLEEVEAVGRVLEALRLGEARWTNREGEVKPLTAKDVL